MKDDTQRVLASFEKELWDEALLQKPEEQTEEERLDALLQQILNEEGLDTGPAFEDPDRLQYSDGPVVYRNYSNDYGNNDSDTTEYADEEETETEEARHGKLWLLAWLCVASAVCFGILGALLYWMEAA